MKYPLAIFTAAATAVGAIIKAAVADMGTGTIDPDSTAQLAPISGSLVEQMVYAGATSTEIADRFLIEESFLLEEYHDVFRRARAVRSMHLRKSQFELARKLNGPMLIWLGRNELGQSLSPSKPGEPAPDFDVEEMS